MTYVKKYAGDWKWLYIGCQISFGLSILNGICGTLFRQNIFTCILAQSIVTVLTAFALLTDPGASKSEYNEYIIESSQKKYKNQKQDWNRGQQTGRLLDKMYDNLQRMIDCNHARLIFQYPISTNQLDWVYYELVWIRGEYQKKNQTARNLRNKCFVCRTRRINIIVGVIVRGEKNFLNQRKRKFNL